MKLAHLAAGIVLITATGCGGEAVSKSEEPPVMSMPALPEASALAGSWTLSGPDGSCTVDLGTAAASAGPTPPEETPLPAQVPAACGLVLTGWRPVPLGLELTNAEGRGILVFEQTGPEAYTSIDQAWTLTRG